MKLFFTLLLVFSGGLVATPIHYQGEMDNTIWKTELQFDRCEIYTEIADRGFKISFIAQPGKSLSLKVYSRIHSAAAIEESFAEVINAPWYEQQAAPQEQIRADSIGEHSINFRHGVEEIFQYMLAGSWLQFYSMSNSEVVYIVSLPTTLWQKETVAFNRCANALPAINYEAISHLSFNYIINQYKLNKKQTEDLTKLSDYINKDSSVIKILIDGHSDDEGSSAQNLRLSKLRADEIAQILINKAVNPDLIEMRGHGGRYPIASNDSAEGRKKNRRVTVRLVKVNAQTTATKKHKSD
ncbi:MAG: outer membrane protein OmpA-like peptidoglycan-associated protein [Psychromonas sp.]|jgi:outer membrane protein OmpA-like peptidoglycan-associated protein|uniref:OmpA family protein n=1 Tax=Psychromonas sp. TaxID=1884585 RepID=UPI0039E4C16B